MSKNKIYGMKWFLMLLIIAAFLCGLGMNSQKAAAAERSVIRTNVALGKDVTGIDPNEDSEASVVTDGNTDCIDGYSYYEIGYNKNQNPANPYYVQIDLGDEYLVDQINLWRYYIGTPRIYHDTIVFVSEDETFTEADIVYNSDTDNFFGFGTGRDEEYYETAVGKEISFSERKARYIRVMNNGHTMYTKQGGHYVEIQVWGSELPSAMEHGDEPLKIPTFDAEGKEEGETHPDIIKFDKPWNGYTYWMAVTPNQEGNSQFENPCIAASNDGIHWETPNGIENPLTGIKEEISGVHNCDGDMVYNEAEDCLYLYYNWAKDEGINTPNEIRLIKIRSASAGFEVSKMQTVVVGTAKYDLLSPAVARNADGTWMMWTVNTGTSGYNNQNNFVELRTSNDGIKWSNPISLAEGFKQPGYQPWHLDVKYIPEKNEYWAFFPCYPNGGQSGYTELFFARSTDGMSWISYEKPVLKPRENKWDGDFIYRSTFLYDADSDKISLWYAAGASSGWKIAYTENTYEAMTDRLGNTAEHTVLYTNWVDVPVLGGRVMLEKDWIRSEEEGSSGIAYSYTKGAKAELEFYGTGVRWIGQKDTNFGTALVYLDGKLEAEVNTRGEAQWGVLHFEKTGLKEGLHTISIEPKENGVVNESGAVDIEKFVIQYDQRADIPITSVRTLTDKSTVSVGNKLKASAVIFPCNAPLDKVIYKSSDEKTATVNQDGEITARAPGKVRIIASVEGVQTESSAEITILERRMKIDNANPLLLVHLYGGEVKEGAEIPGIPGQGGSTLMGTWNMIPDNIKPYTAIQLHRGFLDGDDNDTLRTFFEENLKIAQRNNVNTFLTIVTGGNSRPLAPEWVETMFQTYSCLKGLVFTENWYGGDDVPENMAVYLEVAAENGGHFVWTDANLTDHAMERWMNIDSLYEAAQKYRDNFVICSKSTASHGFANVRSVGMGYWLSDLCGNWGSLTDSWYWYEKGYWRLFDQETSPYVTSGGGYDNEEARCTFQFPETMYSMNMLQTYANGGVVYNFEHPYYCTGVNDIASHALTKAIIPVMEYAVKHPAPTKKQVLEVIKVAYSSREGYMPEDFQYGLYGDEWDGNLMQNSGRYYTVPIIHSRVDEEILNRFDHVIDLDDIEAMSVKEKTDWFNKIYPEISAGNAYVQKINTEGNPHWLVFNSNDNQNIDQNAEILTKDSYIQKMNFSLTPHTYLLAEQLKDGVCITLNNYRANKDEIWDGYNGDYGNRWNGDWNHFYEEYLLSSYLPNPDVSELRTTSITLSLSTGAKKPILEITGDEGQYTYSESYDSTTGKYILTVNHNGQAEIRLKKEPEPNRNVSVNVPKTGTKFTSGILEYEVTKSDAKTGTVSVSGLSDKNKTKIVIPETVQKDGVTFQVTAINKQIFQKNRKLVSVTIGANIASIGAKCFYQCSKLKTVIFKGAKSPKIESKAFGKIKKNCKITVPKKISKKELKKLKKAMKSAGKKVVWKKAKKLFFKNIKKLSEVQKLGYKYKKLLYIRGKKRGIIIADQIFN